MLNSLCLVLHLVKKVLFVLFILLALDYTALSHRLFELFPFLSVIFWINIFLELFRKLSHRLFHLVLSHFELVRHLFLLTLPLRELFKFKLLLFWGHLEHTINLLLFTFLHFELSQFKLILLRGNLFQSKRLLIFALPHLKLSQLTFIPLCVHLKRIRILLLILLSHLKHKQFKLILFCVHLKLTSFLLNYIKRFVPFALNLGFSLLNFTFNTFFFFYVGFHSFVCSFAEHLNVI
jgi:hypothetical protein